MSWLNKTTKIMIIFIAMLFIAGIAFAVPQQNAHTPSVTIDPSVANCNELGNTFTLHVTNNISSINSLFEVRIYEAVAGLSDFHCGPAPLPGWELFDHTAFDGYCEYKTQRTGSNVIHPGETKDFTFTATMSSEACYSQFIVSTLDNAVPVGEHIYSYPTVLIDCTPPVVDKSVGDPKVLLDPQDPNTSQNDYWINFSSVIDVSANDNTDIDECNLGLDYCRWTFSLDGHTPADWTNECHTMGGTMVDGWCKIENGPTLDFDFWFNEESEHNITVECYDIAGNKTVLTEKDKVDDTPPVTTKEISEPKKVQDGVEWIDAATNITLTAVDPDTTGMSCNIGVAHTYYNIELTNDEVCWAGSDCRGLQGEFGGQFQEYTGPISGSSIPESCHVMRYYSVDGLGNTEEVKTNCFFVDHTPPVVEKTVGQPSIDGTDLQQCPDTQGLFHWVTPVTPISFTCMDQGPHPSHGETLLFKVWYDLSGDVTSSYCTKYSGNMSGGWCSVPSGSTYPFVFNFNSNEDSVHKLEYKCMDAVGKTSTAQTQYYKVDGTHPVIEKTMLGQYLGDCPPGQDPSTDRCFVGNNGVSGVHIALQDTGETSCVVGRAYCDYDVWWYRQGQEPQRVDYGTFTDETGKDIIFHEDSNHLLSLECHDALGNEVYDDELFLVDSTPPVTKKTYGPEGTFYVNEKSGAEWIDTATRITMTATDNKVGVDKTYYKVTAAEGDTLCQSMSNCSEWQPSSNASLDGWTQYVEPFNDIPQSCHVIEFFSVDKLGNKENVQWQCPFVDKTVPVVNKDNGRAIAGTGEPLFTNEGNPNGDFHFITTEMPVTFSCEDQLPHPAGARDFRFKVSYDYPSWRYITEQYCDDYHGNMTDGGWCVVPLGEEDTLRFYFQEESMHNLEYYCTDKVGKESPVHVQYYKVDDTPPAITKVLSGPTYGQCPPRPNSEDRCYVDTATSISLETVDGGEVCHVDGVQCKWRYQVHEYEPGTEGDWSDWSSVFPITFPEESYHTLQIECSDALGNTSTDTEYFVVDKSKPVTTKEYGQPIFPDSESHPKWITGATPITLSATDPLPHPSGVKETKYRVTRVDDKYCEYAEKQEYNCESAEGTGEFQTYNGYPFTIGETSCHLIEYYSVDNVNKTEDVKKQCTYVDNEGPNPVKLVGEPKDTWTPGENGDPTSIFYPEINETCWATENGIECWQVTLLTPVTMTCDDPQPHPVDHETIHFVLGLDGSSTYPDDFADSQKAGRNVTEYYCELYGGHYNSDTGECTLETSEKTIFFSEETEHNLAYYCVDALGNVGPVDDEKFKVEGTTFDIQLNKKWNLISIPFVLQGDQNVVTVFDDIDANVDSVWSFDAATNTWSVYRPVHPEASNLYDLEPGKGYWVAMLNKDLLKIGGSLFSPATTPPSVDLVRGWNLIGYYGTDGESGYFGPNGNGDPAYCELYSLGSSLLDKGWTSLFTYWEPFNPHQWVEYGYSSAMDPGAGYWVFASEEASTYAYTTTCGIFPAP